MKRLEDHLEDIKDSQVIVRCNFDVPIENGQVQDTTRIEDATATLKTLRQHNCQLVLLAHYDRPDNQPDPEKSLRPVVPVLENQLGEPVEFVEYSPRIQDVTIPRQHPISLLENLRFWPGEEANDQEFAKALSGFGHHYVNEAFANCHRQHASIVGIPQHLPSYAGLGLSHEIEVLSKIKNHPDKPLVIVIGGAKLETKEPLIAAFADQADYILVGGKSAVDLQSKGNLPANVVLADLTPDTKDITLESAHRFADIIHKAHTVIWNGTMGVFEEEAYRQGTTIVAQAINQTSAFTLIGGGDTETALTILDLQAGIDFISTGGGAMLTYLCQGDLVGLKPLA